MGVCSSEEEHTVNKFMTGAREGLQPGAFGGELTFFGSFQKEGRSNHAFAPPPWLPLGGMLILNVVVPARPQVIGLDDIEGLLGPRPFASTGELRNIDRYEAAHKLRQIHIKTGRKKTYAQVILRHIRLKHQLAKHQDMVMLVLAQVRHVAIGEAHR
eukprot:scaffold192232_cov22-Tisochrysis_lutea.AAC.2